MRMEPTAPTSASSLLSLSGLLLATSLSSSRISRMRLTKAFLVMMSTSESMITALLGSKETKASSMA